MLEVRPRIEELEFRVYDRPVGPVGAVAAERTIRRNDYTLTVRLTMAGHVLEWSNRRAYLMELTTPHPQALPTGGLLAHRFQGERRGRCEIQGVRYTMCLHAEVVPPDVFLFLHDELCQDGAKRGLLHHFAPHARLSLTPLGWVTIDVLPTGLSVATFHTFPSQCAVVKTQSLIEP